MTIDVFADIVCPWCYVGERRLDRALTALNLPKLEWRWKPFQLQPQMPSEGLPWRAFAERKFGGWDRAEAAFNHVLGAAQDDAELAFDFDKIASAPNTVDAHRLVLWAETKGLGRAMASRLFRAYFAEGANLNDMKHLVALAEEVGLSEEAARTLLSADTYAAEVEHSQAEASELGVQGVPFYLINERYGISGAQSVEVMQRTLRLISEEEQAYS